MSGTLIFVIEDDEKNRKLARDILEYHGYRVVAAESAETGLALLARERPALILMDIHLPGMSGLEAIRQIRADPQSAELVVVAFSASLMPSERQKILEGGFDALLPKPIDLREFVGTIQRLIGNKPG